MNLKFLPLGSVCLVDGADLKLVVIGYKSNGFDYIAVEYPNGYEGAENLRYFNHEQIKDLYSYGYKDEFGQTHFSSLNDDILSMSDVSLVNENIEYSTVIDEAIISDEELEGVQKIENTNSMGSYKFDENGFYASDKDFELLDEKISTLGTNFEENPVKEEIVNPEISFSVETADSTLGTNFEEELVTEEIVNPKISFSMEAEDLTLGTNFEENPVQEEIVNPENSFSVGTEDLTLGTNFEEELVIEEIVNPEVSFSVGTEDLTLGTNFEEESVTEEIVNPKISFSMEAEDLTLGTNFEENPVQEEIVNPENSFSVGTEDLTLGTNFEENPVQEVINPEISFQFDENGMVVLDTTTPVEESVENTTDTLFEDVEIPSEVEVQPEVSNEENLEVGTLSTEEDKSIFEEMTFSDEVKTNDEVVNFDIPALENAEVPKEDESLATFDTKEEPEENKKEEKKKRGFFNFGK